MDHELTDEQALLTESAERVLARDWVALGETGDATDGQRAKAWDGLRALGVLDIGGDGLGATELCLVAGAIGRHLGSVPFLGSAAVRLALAPLAGTLPDGLDGLISGSQGVGVALLERGGSWTADGHGISLARRTGGVVSHGETDGHGTTLVREAGGVVIQGEKVAIEQLPAVDALVVAGWLEGGPAVAVVPAGADEISARGCRCFDETVLMGVACFDRVAVSESSVLSGARAGMVLDRIRMSGALLAAAEAAGAAEAIFDLACQYAGMRRQFGRAIGSFQAVRHILADAYVRQASGWSAVRYAAAAMDRGDPEAAQIVSITKAYVSRGAREVAHGAMQVFGGIAFTADHPAHRFLRRIGVRAQQFGDAAQHERMLGAALAGGARPFRMGDLVS